MSLPRVGGSATTLADGTVLLVAGNTGSGGPNNAEIYNPATGTFSPTGNLLEMLTSAASILLPSGKVLVLAQNTPLAELYDPANRSFAYAVQMGGSSRTSLFRMPNGTVLAMPYFRLYQP